MPEILVNKIIQILSFWTAAASTSSQEIQLNFIPDEVIVRSASVFVSTGGAPTVYGVQTNLPINQPKGIIIYHSNQQPQVPMEIHYQLKQPINGTYTFNLYSPVNDILSPIITGQVILILDFIKYK